MLVLELVLNALRQAPRGGVVVVARRGEEVGPGLVRDGEAVENAERRGGEPVCCGRGGGSYCLNVSVTVWA